MDTFDTDRLIKLLLFLFVVSLAATIFLAYALFVALPRQRVIAQTGGCGPIYTVQQGDSLALIAQKCGVSLADLQALNPSITEDNIAPGQVLTVPQALLAPARATPNPTETPLPTAEPPCPLPTFAPGAFQPGSTASSPTLSADQTGGGLPGSGDDQVGGGGPGSTAATSPAAPSTAARTTSQTRTYTVVPGDTLSAIAARFGVSLQSVIAANPQIANPDLIYPGDVITIPAAIPPTGGEDYIVQPGDTLSAIALRFGVTLSQLLAANPQITNPNLIYPGQAVAIPDGSIPPTGGNVYTIRAGDTLFSIARRFGVTLTALLAANPQITDPNRIASGEQITIPDSTIPPTGGNVYTVQPGDTLYGIAQLYGTTVAQLLILNPQITNQNLIFPGQMIQLP